MPVYLKQWKGFPRMVVAHDSGLGRMFATLMVAAGTWWLLQGIGLAITYAPFFVTGSDRLYVILEWMVAGFCFIAILLAALGPSSVRRLYGGQVLQSTSELVGFEGVMPIAELERLVFGNNNSRLSYEASATRFSKDWRDPDLRVGCEPDICINEEALRKFEAKLPPGHKVFTLVDTGELSVCIFSAERPPTVALLTGSEGGMLRAMLCSWRFSNDCLYKETVVRMPSNVWDSATTKGWLKICLVTQDTAREMERSRALPKREVSEPEVVEVMASPSSSQ